MVVSTWLDHNKIHVTMKTGSGMDLKLAVLTNFLELGTSFSFI